jgi:hypothetical protein
MSWVAIGVGVAGLVSTGVSAGTKSSQNKKAIAAAKQKALTEKTIEARIRLEEVKAKARRQQNNIIVIGSLASLGIAALIYTTTVNKQTA